MDYSCKYAPLELIEAFGSSVELLDREEESFEVAEELTHANLCCHAKSLIQQGLESSELLIMNCCDSLRRTYDVLDFEGKQDFLYLIDLPHEDKGCSIEYFARDLMKFAQDYARLTQRTFDKERFIELCGGSDPLFLNQDFVALVGGRISPELEAIIRQTIDMPLVNLTCCGSRNLEAIPDEAYGWNFEELMRWYAEALLRMIPCMRMTQVSGRRLLFESPHLKGVIYNTVKFCDFYSFDYAQLKNESKLPLLKIESDYTPTPPGQLATRLLAFAESFNFSTFEPKEMTVNTSGTYYAGIDSGSTTTNMVVLDQSGDIAATAIVRTGPKAQRGAQEALDAVCRELGASQKDFVSIMATGYGRDNITFATDTKTEISCHAHGAHHLNPKIRTIIDIGGQDSKVISLDENGDVANFVMNDKCAAGTGRFLEMMARTLELDLAEMSVKGLDWKKDLTLSSMCTVFAESEVISLIADNHSDCDIVHGLNKSVASKTVSMVRRSKGVAPYMMTGGVARNRGVVTELEDRLGEELFVSDQPDLCGALGAALYAWEQVQA